MDSWKAVLRPMCKVLVISKMEILLVSYQRIEMRRKEGEGFTTGRDPTGGVFEEKLSLLKTSFKNALSLSIKICRYLFFKRKKCFYKTKELPLSLPPYYYAFILPIIKYRVVCEYIPMYSYWFRPCLLSWPDYMRRSTRKKVVMTAMRTRTFSQSVACRVMARDLGSPLFDDSAASIC